MFSNIENLDPQKHKELRFMPSAGFAFASKLASVPLSASEVSEAAKFYPLAFSTEGPLLPVALLSLRDGDNAYLNDENKWIAPYVPAHVRRYPFILGKTDDPEKFTMMVDINAPHLNTREGEALYDDEGKNTATLNNATKFLTMFQQELEATAKLLEPLKTSDVLAIQDINMKDRDGKEITFKGMHIIDQQKLVKLDDATLGTWVRGGLIMLIYSHITSLKNLMGLSELQKRQRQKETKAEFQNPF